MSRPSRLRLAPCGAPTHNHALVAGLWESRFGPGEAVFHGLMAWILSSRVRRTPLDGRPPDPKGYDAFLSYSHALDSAFAAALHFTVETFGTALFSSRRLRIFKDDASLAMTNDLWEELKGHLLGARSLIVLLNPSALASVWVRREIRTFIEAKGRNRLYIVLTGGKLPWTDKDFSYENYSAAIDREIKELICPDPNREPLVLDLRAFRNRWARMRKRSAWQTQVATLVSGITGEPKDVHVGAHLAALRSRVATLGALALFSTVAAVIAVDRARQAQIEAQVARSRELAAQASLETAENPDRALLLAARAYDVAPTGEARGALFDSLTRHPGLRWVGKAVYGGASTIRSVPGREAILSFNGSNLYQLWDVASLAPGEIRTLPSEGQVFALDFLKSHSLLVAGGSDGRLQLVDPDTAAAEASLTLHQDGPDAGSPRAALGVIRTVAAHPERPLIAVGIGAAIVLVQAREDPVSLSEEQRIAGAHEISVNWLGFLPDGRLVSLGWDSVVRIWDLGSNPKSTVLAPRSGSNEGPLDISVDGRWITAPVEGGLVVWDLERGTHRRFSGLVDAAGEAYTPRLGRFNAASGQAIAAAWANAGALWTVEDPLSPRTIAGGHAGNMIETIFMPDGRILTSGVDERLHIWDFAEPFSMASMASVGDAPLRPIELAGRDGLIAVIVQPEDAAQHRILLYDITATGMLEAAGSIESGNVRSLAIAPDGRSVAAATETELTLYRDTERIATARVEPSVTAMLFSGDSSLIITGHRDGSVRIRDAKTLDIMGAVIETADTDAPPTLERHITDLDWREDGRDLVIATASGEVSIRDIGRDAWEIPADPNPYVPRWWDNIARSSPTFVAVDPNLDSLFIVCDDQFQIVSLSNGAFKSPELTLPMREHIARDIVYDDKSGLLFVVLGANLHGLATSGPLVVIDARTGQLVGQPLTSLDSEIGVELLVPGQLLATFGADGLRFWTLSPKVWQDLARAIAGRGFDDSERRRYGLD